MSLKSIAQGLHRVRVMKEARAKVAAQVAAERPCKDPCGPFTKCRYHATGGPETIRCGDDTYTGYGSKVVP